jgi:ribonuclease D
MWIDTARSFADFCAAAARQDVLAIDLEFQGEGRYTPHLCLVQLGFEGTFVAVDPFQVNLAPLGPLLADPKIQKLFHAGSQDAPILRRETGVTPVNVFDTQIAAAFLGYGDSLGYVALVQRLLKVSLNKRQRFTDWTRRPLSEEQIEYALNDVRHLVPIAAMLKAKLIERGRLVWAQETCGEMIDHAVRQREPGAEYLRLGKLSGMSRRELGVLRELAVWREETARERDRPLGSIINDDALRQVCYALPKTEQALRQVRGVRELPRGAADGLLAAIKRGLSLPEAELPPSVPAREVDPTIEGIASLLGAVVRSRAAALDLAQTLLANRDDLVHLAIWIVAGSHTDQPPRVPALTGWRAEIIGALLLEMASGKVAVRIQPDAPGGVVMEPVS